MRKIREYFTYRGIYQQVISYGYVYSWKRYLFTMMVMGTAFALGGALFLLRLPYMLVIMVTGFMCLPVIVKGQYYTLYQQKRFRDVDLYLHQMIYSFQKQPKISIALSDAYKVADGRMREMIQLAMDELKYGLSQWVYVEALEKIEKEYSCDRLSMLHRFMVSVEEKGGSYHNSINVLLGDLDRWVKRVYQSQEEIKLVKRDITIGIIISVILATTTVIISWILKTSSFMEMQINDDPLYQIVSTAFLIGCMLFFTYTQVHYSTNWLTSLRTDRQIAYDLKLVRGEAERKGYNLYLWGAGFGLAAASLIFKNYILTVCILICVLVVGNSKSIIKKAARRRIEEDVYTGFSEWLRDVALGLQEKTMQAAIQDSYDSCPLVMKESLERFIDQLEFNPSAVEPYYDFMSEFRIADISTGIRTLYGLSELDHTNIDQTINGLISRNYEMQDKHEAGKQSDRISLMKFSEYIPVLMVSIKMGMDMMLLITGYL